MVPWVRGGHSCLCTGASLGESWRHGPGPGHMQGESRGTGMLRSTAGSACPAAQTQPLRAGRHQTFGVQAQLHLRVSALTFPAPALGLEDGHQKAVTLEGKKKLSGNGRMFGRTYCPSMKYIAMQTSSSIQPLLLLSGSMQFLSTFFYLFCYDYLDPSHYQCLLPIIIVPHFSNVANSGSVRNASFKE